MLANAAVLLSQVNSNKKAKVNNSNIKIMRGDYLPTFVGLRYFTYSTANKTSQGTKNQVKSVSQISDSRSDYTRCSRSAYCYHYCH